MTKTEIIKKAENLQELESFIEELKAEADAIRDSIKAEMLELGVEEMEAGKFIIRWTPVLSNRFDSTAFKKLHAGLYQDFIKQVSSRRFTVSC